MIREFLIPLQLTQAIINQTITSSQSKNVQQNISKLFNNILFKNKNDYNNIYIFNETLHLKVENFDDMMIS